MLLRIESVLYPVMLLFLGLPAAAQLELPKKGKPVKPKSEAPAEGKEAETPRIKRVEKLPSTTDRYLGDKKQPALVCTICYESNFVTPIKASETGYQDAVCDVCRRSTLHKQPAEGASKGGGGGEGLDLPSRPRGGAVQRPTGSGRRGIEPDSVAGTRATPETPPATPRAGAARLILVELAELERVEDSLARKAVDSLLRMGEEGRTVATEALRSDHAPTMVAGARALVRSGDPAAIASVVERMRRRIPSRTSSAVVAALVEHAPEVVTHELMMEWLDHPQASLRSEAAERLESRVKDSDIAALRVALSSKRSDTRLRAARLVGSLTPDVSWQVLIEHLSDTNPRVASTIASELARSPSAEVEPALLERAFSSRWILRDEAYALVAICEREDLRLDPLLDMAFAPKLLEAMQSTDPFVAGVAASALAGIGFRAESTDESSWLDQRVTDRLVWAVSGRDFHSDFSVSQELSARRLSLLTGESFGIDGGAWVDYWLEHRPDFRARRARLDISPEDQDQLIIGLRPADPTEPPLTLYGPDAAAQRFGSKPSLPPRPGIEIILTEADTGSTLDLLRREGLLDASRVPGMRGVAGGDARMLEMELGDRGKAFAFPTRSEEPWFTRACDRVRALGEAGRWQLYGIPEVHGDRMEDWAAESAWWSEEHTEFQRMMRLKERILSALPSRSAAERTVGLHDLERLYEVPDVCEPKDRDALLVLLAQEKFQGGRVRTLVDLAIRTCRMGPETYDSDALRGVLAALMSGLGEASLPELVRVARQAGRPFSRSLARDGSPALRMVATMVLADEPGEEDVHVLMSLLDDKVEQVELSAIAALGDAGAEEARTEILLRARIGEGRVRTTALQAAGALGGDDAHQALMVALAEKDTDLKRAAVDGLVRLEDRKAVPLLVAALNLKDAEVAAAARQGLLGYGSMAWEDLLKVVYSPAHPSRREVALLLAKQNLPDVVPALIGFLEENTRDGDVAFELAVLSARDYRVNPAPLESWQAWWGQCDQKDPRSWFLGALEEIGLEPPPSAAFIGHGTEEAAEFLVAIALLRERHLAERARRELEQLLDRPIPSPPSSGGQRDDWRGDMLSRVRAHWATGR